MTSNLLDCIHREQNSDTVQLSALPLAETLRLLNQHDAMVAECIAQELASVEAAVNLIVRQIKAGGRLIYLGAGTSGRLGVLDSAECPPTFGTSPELVQSIIAGGLEAMLAAVEDVEDDRDAAIYELTQRHLTEKDVVMGIAASGRTPFVVAGMQYANSIGAKTIALCTRGGGEICDLADVAIAPDVGAEVLSGSTRMKSGSAQKMLLGMISTAVMIQLGKVHGNLMIDVVASNEKLRKRAEGIVAQVCEVDIDTAAALLSVVKYNVRAAILKYQLDISAAEALVMAAKPFKTLTSQLEQA
ncbi:N-acetylmuramic acid 6-phosphate etherase [Thaumasiovibrio subtropicus]|uniref:N-acetylmuramic acid 6-phosphate etherase n=1 Tax=Thaumasiovibrio subtropicus TaxID=1891207 RepID=UPI000B35D227|nr:N-acetylmuramic acid 6-phosphate etherase [Thaumasiovibrio subtropicus]